MCQAKQSGALNTQPFMVYNDVEMNAGKLPDLKAWFADYVAAFKTGKADFDRNIILKEEHTKRVCQEIRFIGENLGMEGNDLLLAEVMALFHDIGRFEQYARYRTFVDRISVDHAEFGVGILRRKHVLDELAEDERELILRAILYHNRRDLPEDETDTCLHFSRMLRDADKLDIWNVLADYYRNGRDEDSVLVQNFPDTPGISEAIYRELAGGRLANYADVRNLNDYKLLQAGWIYDINFTPSFRRIYERGYLETIRAALPQSDQVNEIFTAAQSYLKDRIQSPL